MDLVMRVLNGWLDGFSKVVDFAAGVVQKIGGAFGVQFSPVAAQLTGGLAVIFIVIALLQRVLWGGGGLRMFRPQAVVHLTSRTPFQVVMQDLTGCLTGLVFLAVLLIIVVLLFGGTGTPGTFQ